MYVENFYTFDKTSYFFALEKYVNRYIIISLAAIPNYKERRVYGKFLSKRGQEIDLRNK